MASHRVYSFAKYLPLHGIHVDVLTPRRPGNLEYDISDMSILYSHDDPSTYNVFNRKSGVLKKIVRHAGARPVYHYLTSRLYRETVRTFDRSRYREYDAILASFGPEGVLRLARFLSRKLNLPLILDYRDLWYDHPFYPTTPCDDLMIRCIEGRIIRGACLVTTVSEGLAGTLRKRYGCNPSVVYNGYFDDDVQDSQPRERSDVPENGLRIGYFGSLYGGQRPIQMIFPLMAERENLQLITALFDEVDCRIVSRLAKQWNVEDRVEIHRGLRNDEAMSLQSGCDILLFLNKIDGSAKGILSGKLFEYMAARTFVLGIGHRNDEAARIIEECRLGIFLDDEASLPSVFDCYHDWEGPDETGIQRYTRARQAKRLATMIKERLSLSSG